MIYTYAPTPHSRRHGPRGYTDYRSFKEWLRDEFCFRCVYCLTRERWSHSGPDGFSTEHDLPRIHTPERETDYENLLYSCVRCNSLKREVIGLPNPCQIAFGSLLWVSDDGQIFSDVPAGQRLIKVLQLDDPEYVSYRRRMIATVTVLATAKTAKAPVQFWLGFPDELPDLSLLRPPLGNSHPEGISQSYFAQRMRGELPEMY